jgi:hypothetical protein
MNQVESVPFWIGLISSVVGIVLSIVAIVFSILVDRRSSTISDRTIQSLQKIESAVERSSSDTRDLIKAGWDKMLGNVERSSPSSVNDTSAKEVAAGIAAELRSELKTLSTGQTGTADDSKQRVDQLEKYIKDLEASLVAQLKTAHSDVRPSAKFDEVSETIRQLSETAYALLRAIRYRHLTQKQYRDLSKGRLEQSLLELRRNGLLVPVVHKTSHGPEPCYYMPSGMSQLANAAMQVFPKPSLSVAREAETELRRIGYPIDRDESEDFAKM